MKQVTVDMQNLTRLDVVVRNPAVEGYRLDVYLTKRLQSYSRTLIQRLIKDGFVTVNGRGMKPSYEVSPGDNIALSLPRLIEPQMKPEAIPLDVVYEDDYIVVVNKPPRFVVHPAAGHWEGTLVNALLHHCGVLPQTDDIYRPGIVHRLDKDTSGVIIAAKTAKAHFEVSSQFEERTVKKEYLAVVEGEMRFDSDVIDKPIGRDPHNRERMKVFPHEKGRAAKGGPAGDSPAEAKKKKKAYKNENDHVIREAVTLYEVVERFTGFTFVRLKPHTGRTHQLRVHLASLGNPVVADSEYGRRDALFLEQLCPDGGEAGKTLLIDRQALHSSRLTCVHPVSGKEMTFEAPLPADMEQLLQALRVHKAAGATRITLALL